MLLSSINVELDVEAAHRSWLTLQMVNKCQNHTFVKSLSLFCKARPIFEVIISLHLPPCGLVGPYLFLRYNWHTCVIAQLIHQSLPQIGCPAIVFTHDSHLVLGVEFSLSRLLIGLSESLDSLSCCLEVHLRDCFVCDRLHLRRSV